ncbi:hypothetical protein ACRALDRAFT_2034306 [Sodiomyces alcalophilus JCM 7366]|uniref:uncharacterized protein n=1 Tax=Sodiomyces alcalophilus JCM 7366 TaxID=591952 RepID=UPI0039B662B6
MDELRRGHMNFSTESWPITPLMRRDGSILCGYGKYLHKCHLYIPSTKLVLTVSRERSHVTVTVKTIRPNGVTAAHTPSYPTLSSLSRITVPLGGQPRSGQSGRE